MMDALTMRGPQDKDTIKPENRNSETKDGSSKSHSQRNLSIDCDGGSDPKRTSRDRHNQARGREIREQEIVNQRRKLKSHSGLNLSKDHDGVSDPERTSRADTIKPEDRKSEYGKS